MAVNRVPVLKRCRSLGLDPVFLGYDKNFIILDSDDTLTVVKKLMKDLNMNPKYYNARDLRNKIGYGI